MFHYVEVVVPVLVLLLLVVIVTFPLKYCPLAPFLTFPLLAGKAKKILSINK